MAINQKEQQMNNFTTPVGRLVLGSITKAQETDFDGNPLVFKTGPDAGKPRKNYFMALAIPKGAETHWNQTPWGAQIWKFGHEAFPQGQADLPGFSWKIEDGDNAVPNPDAGMKRNCDREGYLGCWILKFSSSFQSNTYNSDGSAKVEPDSIKPGYFIQVNVDMQSNGKQSKSGVYLNHKMIALAAYGAEIIYGPDAAEAGFGASPLPAGASAVPVARFAPPAAPQAPAPAAPAAAPVAPPPPAPAFLQVPPPAAPAHVMLPPANGATYEAMIAAGWTDATLIQMGMMAG
jgi:hypothetical protein